MVKLNGSLSIVSDTVAEHEVMKIRVSGPYDAEQVTIEYDDPARTITITISIEDNIFA
jgi:hypothetical protein